MKKKQYLKIAHSNAIYEPILQIEGDIHAEKYL